MTFKQLNEKLGGSESQSEWSQHPNGGGWVHRTARVDASAYIGKSAIVWGAVSGDARVSGDAWVSGDARVSGNAWVCGNARVSGNAWVCGDAWESSPLFIVGSRHSLTNSKRGHIQIGCQCRTFDWWLENGEAIGRANGYTDEQLAEYKAYVELFKKVGK